MKFYAFDINFSIEKFFIANHSTKYTFFFYTNLKRIMGIESNRVLYLMYWWDSVKFDNDPIISRQKKKLNDCIWMFYSFSAGEMWYIRKKINSLFIGNISSIQCRTQLLINFLLISFSVAYTLYIWSSRRNVEERTIWKIESYFPRHSHRQILLIYGFVSNDTMLV